MKNYTLLLILSCLVLSSCDKGSVRDCATNRPIDAVSLTDAVVLKEGKLVFPFFKFNGIAKIYQQKNGRYVVGFEQMYIAAEADLQIYLSKTPGLSNESFKLFSARSMSGEKYYLLPADFSIDGFNYILIMDDRQNDAVGTAFLN